MYGPETGNFRRTPEMKHPIFDDPEEVATYHDNERWKEEMKSKYPTPESIAYDYRNGHWTLEQVKEIFNDEEIDLMFKECERLESIEKSD